jgi:hypothetical protein
MTRPNGVVDESAGRAIGDIIVREVHRLSPLLAVAINYETAQQQPAIYLAYETADHCMERLRKSLSNKAVSEFEGRVGKYTGEEEHFALQNRLRDRIGDIFNTGEWINPADPVLLDRDPIIDGWANRAFSAILEAIRVEDQETRVRLLTEALDHLRGTLWFAIDYARQHATGKWPPISFVQDFDDSSADLITVMATRKPAKP